MTVLSLQAAWQRISGTMDESRRLFVFPIPAYLVTAVSKEDFASLHEASIDLTLHNFFIVFERPSQPAIDFFASHPDLQVQKIQKRIFVHDDDKFWLHPGEFILGGTREYFAFPADLMANISGRSSWGRTGLIIETARVVHPGFCGIITLEITNVGTVPIALSPGISVAQMVIEEVSHPPVQSKPMHDVGATTRTLPDLTSRRELIPIKPEFSDAWSSLIVKRKRDEQVKSEYSALRQYMDKEGINP